MIDLFPLLRPFIFHLDPEDAHNLTIKGLKAGLSPVFFRGEDDPALKTTVFGLSFDNPVGLAAADLQPSRLLLLAGMIDRQHLQVEAVSQAAAWLMRLEGADTKDWTEQTENARQNQHFCRNMNSFFRS